MTGPPCPEGERINCHSLAHQVGGCADEHWQQYWAMLAGGTDAQVDIPYARWNNDPYYGADENWSLGLTYTHHGGFCQCGIFDIDYEFFGIDPNECYILAPAAKTCLEVGYVCLANAGWTRKTLKGQNIGCWFGHSGDDWGGHPVFTMYHPETAIEDKGTYGYQARIWSNVTCRLAHIFDLVGPMGECDTACSSGLVAYGLAHTALRCETNKQAPSAIQSHCKMAIAFAANMLIGPGGYTGLCGPHMLSTNGRCFTFDHSADGYERGEGTGCMHVKCADGVPDEALACVIGICLNQDGRSASMTAPNGPSQQDCIRGSMKEAMVVPNDIICAELHGTGTALGDPIEVGALRGVMYDREVPLMQTSAKSHIGHLEASAGQAGLQKCIMMCRSAAGSPNCHLLVLNPHMDTNGYPTIFDTEMCDYGNNSGYSGVSSFGFGGANARGDVWCRAQVGYRKTGKIDYDKIDFITVTCPFDDGDINYLDGRAVYAGPNDRFQKGPYHADGLRDEFDTYDYSNYQYKGEYILKPNEVGQQMDDQGLPMFVRGSWSKFSSCDEMVEDDDEPGRWTALVTLGETRFERFEIVINQKDQLVLFPIIDGGNERTRIIGPEPNTSKKYWYIDGRDDEVPAGTAYRITFQWADPYRVSWERVDEEGPKQERHHYEVQGTMSAWKNRRMKSVPGVEDGNAAFEYEVLLGNTGLERFRFCRDGDENQMIYPREPFGPHTLHGGVARGPDALWHKDKAFAIHGVAGEKVILRCEVVGPVVHISAIRGAGDNKTAISWQTVEGCSRNQFYITGDFNNWGMEEMHRDEDRPGVFRYAETIRDRTGPVCDCSFRIVQDKDPRLVYYPVSHNCPPGQDRVVGPNEDADDRSWRVTSFRPGASFEVIFDRRSEDKRKIVSVTYGDDRIDNASMQEFFAAGMGAMTDGAIADE